MDSILGYVSRVQIYAGAFRRHIPAAADRQIVHRRHKFVNGVYGVRKVPVAVRRGERCAADVSRGTPLPRR